MSAIMEPEHLWSQNILIKFKNNYDDNRS